ncbi:MAG: integrase [Ponticaulis sp.]|nr:integrase [Ponticaulis sp.]|tara:strand:- start:45904 stop:47109 length:1206 start_codon:yes stop_codon:yes gene_type:complete
MPLSDIQIRNLKPADKPYKKADGGGLHIYVPAKGSKRWRLAYKFGGKEKLMSFGVYPVVSLARARSLCLEAKTLLAEGVDPMEHARKQKQAAEALTKHTFQKIALELLDKKRREGLAKSTLNKKSWLLSFAFEDFGDKAITEINAPTVLVTLRKQEAAGNFETAKRLRGVIGEVFRYAIATARAENDPTFALRGALVAHKVSHMAAATDADTFGQLIRAIWQYDNGAPATKAALQLMALLYPRPGELRFATWDEFDLKARVWTIPGERAKMRREHKKPLSAHVVKILEKLRPLTGNGSFVFPSPVTTLKPISENTLNQALRRMSFSKDEATSHGFRASASTLLNESGLWDADAIEAELAHVGTDQVRRAYHRARYWDERVRMADWWGDYVMDCLSRVSRND